MSSNKCAGKDDNIMLVVDKKVITPHSHICSLFNKYFIHITSNIGTVDIQQLKK